jgi:hypothetical protein
MAHGTKEGRQGVEGFVDKLGVDRDEGFWFGADGTPLG